MQFCHFETKQQERMILCLLEFTFTYYITKLQTRQLSLLFSTTTIFFLLPPISEINLPICGIDIKVAAVMPGRTMHNVVLGVIVIHLFLGMILEVKCGSKSKPKVPVSLCDQKKNEWCERYLR